MISKEAFDGWRSSPETREILRYLNDYRLSMAMQWASGAEMRDTDQAYATALGELAGLEYEELAKFYDEQSDDRSDQP